MLQPAFFHQESGSVRFWVQTDSGVIGASISRLVLHYSFRPSAQDEDPLQTYNANAEAIATAVRARVAKGSREPVMVREFDLRGTT